MAFSSLSFIQTLCVSPSGEVIAMHHICPFISLRPTVLYCCFLSLRPCHRPGRYGWDQREHQLQSRDQPRNIYCLHAVRVMVNMVGTNGNTGFSHVTNLETYIVYILYVY